MKYSTFLVADENNRRDYRDRQLFANSQGADVYVEFHFNASGNESEGVADNPSSVLVCENASSKSKEMARDYSALVSSHFDYPNHGVVVLEKDSSGNTPRGYYNLFYTKMKAFLLEPLYVSEPEQSLVALSEEGQKMLAIFLVQVIKDHYPDGAKCAFSLGHKFKESSIHDRGAPIVIGYEKDSQGNEKPIHHATLAEADVAEKVMNFAREFLSSEEPAPEPEAEEIILKGKWTIEGAPGSTVKLKRF